MFQSDASSEIIEVPTDDDDDFIDDDTLSDDLEDSDEDETDIEDVIELEDSDSTVGVNL